MTRAILAMIWLLALIQAAPYADEAGEELDAVARELDDLFAAIAQRAADTSK